MSAHVLNAELLARSENERILRLHLKEDLHVDFIIAPVIAFDLADRILVDAARTKHAVEPESMIDDNE